MRMFVLSWLLAGPLAVASISENESVEMNGIVLKPDCQPMKGAVVVIRGNRMKRSALYGAMPKKINGNAMPAR